MNKAGVIYPFAFYASFQSEVVDEYVKGVGMSCYSLRQRVLPSGESSKMMF